MSICIRSSCIPSPRGPPSNGIARAPASQPEVYDAAMTRPRPRRRSETLGSYAPNQFLITLGSRYRLVDGTGAPIAKPSWETLVVFGHEYIHYLDNVSTVAGAMSFLLSQQLLAALSSTMAPDGTSRGSAPASKTLQDGLRQRLELSDFIEGSFDPSPEPTEDVRDFDVVGVKLDPV